MAIFGAGSNWDGDELKEDFVTYGHFSIGWDYYRAKDLFDIVSHLKAGDIIYLKANRGGSRSIRVKAIGVVIRSPVHDLIEHGVGDLKIPVKWLITEEFKINIPYDDGKLTNIRAATFY